MAKFAQYYLEYKNDDMFSQLEWENRQQHFGALFATDESIFFSVGSDENRKVYKHQVYHLSSNRDIIVMRLANDKVKQVEQDFKVHDVKHEPSCFVIIDNRQNCRRIAIQKSKESFGSTDQVKNILLKVVGDKMIADHNIPIDMHPQFYPKDFYKAWNLHQHHTARLRFNINEGNLPAVFEGEQLDDETIMGFAIQLNEENIRKKYRTVLELNPAEHGALLLVDEDSTYIRNLVKFSANTGSSIEIVTSDNSSFRCYIEDEQESENIVTNEIETSFVEALFGDDAEAREKAEGEVLTFVNGMKYTADEKNEKETAA